MFIYHRVTSIKPYISFCSQSQGGPGQDESDAQLAQRMEAEIFEG